LKELIAMEKVKLDVNDERKLKVSFTVVVRCHGNRFSSSCSD